MYKELIFSAAVYERGTGLFVLILFKCGLFSDASNCLGCVTINGCLVNNMFGRVRKEAVAALFQVLSRHFCGWIGKKHKQLQSWCLVSEPVFEKKYIVRINVIL